MNYDVCMYFFLISSGGNALLLPSPFFTVLETKRLSIFIIVSCKILWILKLDWYYFKLAHKCQPNFLECEFKMKQLIQDQMNTDHFEENECALFRKLIFPPSLFECTCSIVVMNIGILKYQTTWVQIPALPFTLLPSLS